MSSTVQKDIVFLEAMTGSSCTCTVHMLILGLIGKTRKCTHTYSLWEEVAQIEGH